MLANSVARKCTVVKKPEDRELIMWVQFLSLSEGGLSSLAKELMEMFPQFIATKSMQEFGTKPGKIYNANQVRKVRAEFPPSDSTTEFLGGGFPIKGDMPRHWGSPLITPKHPCWQDLSSAEQERMLERIEEYKERQAKLPSSYPVDDFLADCRQAAEANLERDLSDLCQDAAWNLNDSRPWYFPNLVAALHQYQTAWVENRQKEIVSTEVVEKISEALDCCIETASIALVEGVSGIGKQFGLEGACGLRPGRVRCVQTPATPDDASFFRAIARPLGVSSALSLKVQQMRERIETTLCDSRIALAFDQAQYLFIASTHREIMFKRINWIMSLANSGVPIFLCATPQFLETQKNAETVSRWNSAQLTKGIHYVPLPSVLSNADLTALAKRMAPEADADSIKALVIYARISGKFLAGIDAVVRRARFVAKRKGRGNVTGDDLRAAAAESVMPSDNALAEALTNTGKTGAKMRRTNPPQVFAMPEPRREVSAVSETEIPNRETRPMEIHQ